ncbi:MAG: sigma-54-dependent Fis family transcriptional regulator [Acidobacteria bacterium]|nr:MAG: sigma-54-dependent Fis family transcriptional regulator [Acidobacteriota bacterium]
MAPTACPPVGTSPAHEVDALVGRNPRIQRIKELIGIVSPAMSAVLVTGESGTGKHLVAEAIHAGSSRANGPLVRVNCSAFRGEALESELFGHEVGAYAGATRARAGALRRAHGGTLVLEEVAGLPIPTQVKLLRAIQEREVQPVGADGAHKVDVRLISTTRCDLSEEVREGRFREDLFFRLNVIPIVLPPLRERPDDIPLLAERFARRVAEGCGRRFRGFTDRALSAMERYDWPGNVRELENACERAVVLADGELVDLHDLPPEIRGAKPCLDGSYRLNTVRLSEVEEIVIRRVLTRTGWNIKRSAELLGITRATLYSKIKKLGLASPRGPSR